MEVIYLLWQINLTFSIRPIPKLYKIKILNWIESVQKYKKYRMRSSIEVDAEEWLLVEQELKLIFIEMQDRGLEEEVQGDLNPGKDRMGFSIGLLDWWLVIILTKIKIKDTAMKTIETIIKIVKTL